MARVLVACEFSGAVRDAFTTEGHYAVSCDLLPSETLGNHYQGSVLDVLGEGWDLMVCHPPCTYMALSGMHWTQRGLRDPKLTEDAVEFAMRLITAPIPRICLEQPMSVLASRYRKQDQIIQPWQFGEDAQKKTCLWLKNLPLLEETEYVPPTQVGNLWMYANQTPSGNTKTNTGHERSRTYSGIARAMAKQWAPLLEQSIL